MIHLAAQYFLNHRLDPDEVRRQTRELAEAGYQAVFAEARPGMLTPYFSADWWATMTIILDVCRETGMEFWIWDEDYFPSGTAGGRITWNEPSLVARGLFFSVHEVDGAGKVELDFLDAQLLSVVACRRQPDGSLDVPVDLSEWCGTRRQNWGPRRMLHSAYSAHVDPVGTAHWRTSFQDNAFALAWTPPEPGSWVVIATHARNIPGLHPDILNPESTRLFLDYLYAPYRERYGDDFGGLIGGVFTDEPSPGTLHFPWSPLLPAAFAADHGYPVERALPHLARDLDAHSPGIRWQFRQTQHRLQRVAFGAQIHDWCRQHQLQFSGHLTRTEWFSLVASWWPNELRFYADFDIPCADPLGVPIGWKEAAAYHSGLKVVSSAAHLFGKAQCGSDSLAVVGDEAALRDFKYGLDFHVVMGLNFLNLHGCSYSLDGPRKDEVPPSLFYQHSEWPYMRTLLDNVRASCEALTGGSHRCEIAVVYPSTSLGALFDGTRPDWFKLPDEAAIHSLVDDLLSHQRDFDFIDEQALQEQVDAQGRLQTPEAYTVVILAYLRYLEAETVAALARLAKAGTRVIAVGSVPRTIARTGEHPVGEPIAVPESISAPSNDWLRGLPGPELTGDGARDVFLLRRHKNGAPVTFAFNRSETAFDGQLDGVPLWIAPRGSALFRDGEAVTDPLANVREVADLSRDWEVTFELNHVPLACWHYQLNDKPVFYGRDPLINLLQRETPTLPEGKVVSRYTCRFMTIGEIPELHLLMEESAIAGPWQATVNGQPVGAFTAKRVFDCLNLEAEITPLLRTGNSPTLNVIELETSGVPLTEVPYLRGQFRVEFRHGHPSQPYLTAQPSTMALSSLRDWQAIGFGSFSGTAIYRRRFTCDAGRYLLDLGQVEDLAAVSLDGRDLGIVAWPPYVAELSELAAGEHALTLRVANGPGNRYRLSGLPAGLIGPVRLVQELTP